MDQQQINYETMQTRVALAQARSHELREAAQDQRWYAGRLCEERQWIRKEHALCRRSASL